MGKLECVAMNEIASTVGMSCVYTLNIQAKLMRSEVGKWFEM